MGLIHDSLVLGKGKIGWAKVKPYLEDGTPYIYEINLKDQDDSTEMVQSHEYLKTI